MIIECSSCHARFRLDEGKIRGKGARVKCRRCGEGIIVLRESRPADASPEARDAGLLDLGSVVRDALGGTGAVSPGGPIPAATGNLIPFPIAPRSSGTIASEPPEQAAAGETARPSPEAPAEKDEVDLAFERLLAAAAEPEASDSAPFAPVEAGGTEGTEPPLLPSPASLPPPEAAEPDAGGIAPEEASVGPALEFGAEEKLDLPPPPADMSGSEEAAPTSRGEEGFLLSDSETLDFLNAARKAPEGPRNADISLSLSAIPVELGAASLRDPSPVEAPGPAAPEAGSAPEAEAEEGFAFERNETPPATAAEVDVPPFRETPPPAPRIEPRAPAGGTSAPTRTAVSPAVIAGVGLTVLLLAGTGYFGFTPSGRRTMESVAPGVAALWGGKPAGNAESRYDVKNVIGYYETGTGGKRILVIKGQVTNLSGKEKSGIRVAAAILDASGKPLAEQVVYAGNVMPGDTLRKMDRPGAEKFFSNRFGAGLANMNVGTGKSVPFMVAFFDAPESIDSYRLEARDGE